MTSSAETQALNSKWDHLADDYDSLRQCWLNERRQIFLQQVLSNLTLETTATNVLELGSGTGWLTRALSTKFPELNFFGIEPNPGYVEYSENARVRNHILNVAYKVSAAEALDQSLAPGHMFDVVLSNDVLHHVINLQETFRQCALRTKPGGRWVAIEPNCLNPYVAFRQGTIAGERNYLPWLGRRCAEQTGWKYKGSRHLFLIPPFIKQVPPFMKAVERVFEHVPFLAGGIVQVFERDTRADPHLL